MLVIGQVTVCVLLLICAAVLLRANNQMHRLDIGVKTRGAVETTIQDSLRSKVFGRLAVRPIRSDGLGENRIRYRGDTTHLNAASQSAIFRKTPPSLPRSDGERIFRCFKSRQISRLST